VTIQGSTTGTNGWNTLSNLALSTLTSVVITNAGYGTNNVYYTNYYYAPGIDYTNTATAAVRSGTNTVEFGIIIGDAPRFLRVIYGISGGSNSIYTASAQLRGKRNFPYQP
jgi:hypothetical protein